MPAWDILKALNMTPQEWGKVSSEEERARLRKKALGLIAKQQPPSIHDRLTFIEQQIAKVASDLAVTTADVKRLAAVKG